MCLVPEGPWQQVRIINFFPRLFSATKCIPSVWLTLFKICVLPSLSSKIGRDLFILKNHEFVPFYSQLQLHVDKDQLLSKFSLQLKIVPLRIKVTHSSGLAWRIPGTVEPGGLPSMGSHRAGQDWSDLAAAAGSRIKVLCSNVNIYWMLKWTTSRVSGP